RSLKVVDGFFRHRVQRFPERIRGQRLQSVRKAPAILDLQRIVIRRSVVANNIDTWKVRRCAAETLHAAKPAAGSAHIGNREAIALSETLFNGKVIFQSVGKLEVIRVSEYARIRRIRADWWRLHGKCGRRECNGGQTQRPRKRIDS